MYKVMSYHYGDARPQIVFDNCETYDAARRLLLQQTEILKGYYASTGMGSDGTFRVFGEDSIVLTSSWVTPMPRRVAWANVWNWASSLESGFASLVHLTESEGLSGVTLCGRTFPRAKGYPSYHKYCKRCMQAAAKRGIGDIGKLPLVDNEEGE